MVNIFKILESLEEQVGGECGEPPSKKAFKEVHRDHELYLRTKTGLPFVLRKPHCQDNTAFRDILWEKDSGHLIPKKEFYTNLNNSIKELSENDCFRVTLYRGTHVMNQRYYHICRIQNIHPQIGEMKSLTAMQAIINKWKKVTHPNLVPVCHAFFTDAFNSVVNEHDSKGSVIIVYEYDHHPHYGQGTTVHSNKALMEFIYKFSQMLSMIHDMGFRFCFMNILENIYRVRDHDSSKGSASNLNVRLFGAGLTDILDYLRDPISRSKKRSKESKLHDPVGRTDKESVQSCVRDILSLSRFLKRISVNSVRPCTHLRMNHPRGGSGDQNYGYCTVKAFCKTVKDLESGKISLAYVMAPIKDQSECVAETLKDITTKSVQVAMRAVHGDLLSVLVKIRSICAYIEHEPDLFKSVPDFFLVPTMQNYMFPCQGDRDFITSSDEHVKLCLSKLMARSSDIIALDRRDGKSIYKVYASYGEVAKVIDDTFSIIYKFRSPKSHKLA